MARANADGYIAMIAPTTVMVNNLLLFKNLPYDPIKDFTPIGMVSEAVLVVAVSNQSGIRTMQDLVARAKKEPGKLFYGTTGIGSTHHLGGILFAGIIGLLAMGILLMFFHAPMLSLLYALAGVVIFSGFVLYDTSELMHRVGPNDTTAAAISLYIDFMGLFYMILRLLLELNGGGSRRSN